MDKRQYPTSIDIVIRTCLSLCGTVKAAAWSHADSCGPRDGGEGVPVIVRFADFGRVGVHLDLELMIAAVGDHGNRSGEKALSHPRKLIPSRLVGGVGATPFAPVGGELVGVRNVPDAQHQVGHHSPAVLAALDALLMHEQGAQTFVN